MIDASPEIKLNLRVALFAFAVIMAATIVGTGYNTYRNQAGAYDRQNLWNALERAETTEAEHFKKLNGRIDYLRRNVNKRFAELDTRDKK